MGSSRPAMSFDSPFAVLSGSSCAPMGSSRPAMSFDSPFALSGSSCAPMGSSRPAMSFGSSCAPMGSSIPAKSSCAVPNWKIKISDLESGTIPELEEMEDLESGTIHELNHELNNQLVPGMWQYPTNTHICCIYRVSHFLYSINPEAYTPRLVLIGPLQSYVKSVAFMRFEDKTNRWLKGYLNTEAHKKIYIVEFARRVKRKKGIDDMRRVIKDYEDPIRASYSESTTWIQSGDFVEMILLDSIFIFEFILKTFERKQVKTGDPLVDEPYLTNAVKRDLILLENQLPYFILEKLAESSTLYSIFQPHGFRKLIISYFGFDDDKIRIDSKFSHFTDLFRCVCVETLPNHIVEKSKTMEYKYIDHMYNTDKLNSGGVEFSLNNEALETEFSLYVSFENGCLKMPCLKVDDELEMTLRNVMALEQCHYPFNAHVCNYVLFLDRLIDTHKDVDLLVEKGIIKNYIGENRSVAEMVNKLCLGVIDFGSYYSEIAVNVTSHYKNRFNRSRAILKSVYFGNLWTGTGTVAAMLLLIMTLIQTVASIIQVMQNAP